MLDSGIFGRLNDLNLNARRWLFNYTNKSRWCSKI